MLDETKCLSIDVPNATLSIADLAVIAGIPCCGTANGVRVSFRVGCGHERVSDTDYIFDVRQIAPGSPSQRAFDAINVLSREFGVADAQTTLQNARLHGLGPKSEAPDHDEIRDMNRSDRFAYELHVKVAAKLREHPERVKYLADRNLQKSRDREAGTSLSLRTWEELLTRSTEELIGAMLDKSIRGQWLRSSSVFSGVLSDDERTNVLRQLSPT